MNAETMNLMELLNNMKDPQAQDFIMIKLEEINDYDYEELLNKLNLLATEKEPLMLLLGEFRIIINRSPSSPSITIWFDFTNGKHVETFAEDIMFENGVAKFSPLYIVLKISEVLKRFSKHYNLQRLESTEYIRSIIMNPKHHSRMKELKENAQK